MNDFIKSFFSGLSKSEKKIFYIACIIIGVALFDRVIIGPIAKETTVIGDKISSETNMIKQNVLILRYKDAILDKYVMYGKYFTKKGLTEEEMIAEFLNEIEELAAKSKVSLTNINPVNTEQKGENVLYTLTVECSATMNDFINLIYGIDNTKKLLRVVSFNIAPKDRDSYSVKASIKIEKFIVYQFPEDFFTA
ncbi:MAG TPA: hypothetical protein PKY78_01270 [Candidatus Omnitrophota bacterium]|nr:hypothetical protein [Candidatus Omnitrophota bacterium]HPS19610.1 hypothetical protein [Candidatus Omnitrophota bacterium]